MMYLKNNDLTLLEKANKMLADYHELTGECPIQDTIDELTKLIDRLNAARDVQRVKSRELVAEKRKTDKNYARSKKIVSE